MASRPRGTSRLVSVLLAVALVVGVGLLLYPTLSDLWNAHVQSRVVVSYVEAVEQMDEATRQGLLTAARDYNERLRERDFRWRLSDEELAEYEGLLDVDGTGVMAYVEIPQIDVMLPVYHGTSEGVLSVGAGHIEGSSLPVGGGGTHAVLSGHRGLPSARLFTDLDQLAEGDVFYLHVLGETLAYEVDQILTVEPDELDALEIVEGEDLCTLVTCTPYGINSHRLLVRGHRVAVPEAEEAPAEPRTDDTFFAAIGGLLAVAVLAVGGSAVVRRRGKRARGRAGGRHGRQRGGEHGNTTL